MSETTSKNIDLYAQAKACLDENNPDRKVAMTQSLAQSWRDGQCVLADSPVQPIGEPGRPTLPKLVTPKKLPKRSMHTDEGIAALVHALCHIEFNAINLGWDAVYRFRGLPQQYYADWLRVADEEAYHFTLLRDYLKSIGYDYGSFNAHDGLWEMAIKTADDPLIRMALVPRVLEARGLDVTPGIMARFQQAGIQEVVDILEIIQRDEVGHVEIGSRWFHYLCEQRSLDADSTFRDLLQKYMQGKIKPPLDRKARLQAGFSEEELDYLEGVGSLK
ncbi:MAG: ferritin-like domain-containing protein [Gammaproteobacteria bacterium]|nr:ferritin-like domain-containing protein [Gammaproteobacteria bacterium]